MKKWEGYVHGINLGGWLSQCPHTKEHYDRFITEKDFETIASWGLDHVRLPVDYELVEDREGNSRPDGYRYIDFCLEMCGKYHLNMILDLHKTYGFFFHEEAKETGFFEDPALQERFIRLWEGFASRYARYGSRVAFELLNEVTEPRYSPIWNDIAARCVRRLRAIAPDTKLLIGSYWNNSAAAVKDLAAPADENIVYNFHCYEPLVFTHQGAGWIREMPRGLRCGVECTEGELKALSGSVFGDMLTDSFAEGHGNDPFGKDFFLRLIREAAEKAEKEGVPLYCGEYGVIELADREQTLRWYAAIHAALDEYGIGRAAWTYKRLDFDILGKKLECVFR